MTISYKTKQFSLVLIKIGVVVIAFNFIYTKLFHNRDLDFDEFIQISMDFSSISVNTILILLFLSIFNWFFEILKWQKLVDHISETSFNEAATQTLSAFTASLLTPNRIGDYGAKAMYFPSHLRKKIMLLNLVGNSAQMGITTIVGTVGFVYLAFLFQPELNYSGSFICLAVIGIISLLFIWMSKLKWFQKLKESVTKLVGFLKAMPNRVILKVVLYALVRYLIFSFQFYYLLQLFGVDMSYLNAMVGISSMYLLSSIIPSIFIFDVVVKGGVAVFIFGLFGIADSIILAIVTFMWILNFVLPSVIGSYYVLRFKLPKTVS